MRTEAERIDALLTLQMEELSQRGKEIYDTKLKACVEPQYNNQYIAIHVDSEDYVVAKSTGVATRTLRKKYPVEGRIYLRKIGNEPEYALAARLLLGEMIAEPRK